MATSKKPRKKYKPKNFADMDPLRTAIARTQTIEVKHQLALQLPVRISFESFIKGEATVEDFNCLNLISKFAMVICKKIDRSLIEICDAAETAITRTSERYVATNKLGLDGLAISQIRALIELYEELLTFVTPAQIKTTLAEINRTHKLVSKP